MKAHEHVTPRQEVLAERKLCAAIAALKTTEECQAFLRAATAAMRRRHVGSKNAVRPYWEVVRKVPAMDEPRLKLAVQKSGRLTDPSVDLLARCGLKLSRGKDQLIGFGENMPLDVLFVRDDDIPDLVQEDVCDLGLVGLNVLEEKRLELTARGQSPRFYSLRTLDFGRCRLSLVAPQEFPYEGPPSLQGRRI